MPRFDRPGHSPGLHPRGKGRPGDPPRVMRVSAALVRQFLTAAGLPPSGQDQAAQAGRAETTDVTGTGP